MCCYLWEQPIRWNAPASYICHCPFARLDSNGLEGHHRSCSLCDVVREHLARSGGADADFTRHSRTYLSVVVPNSMALLSMVTVTRNEFPARRIHSGVERPGDCLDSASGTAQTTLIKVPETGGGRRSAGIMAVASDIGRQGSGHLQVHCGAQRGHHTHRIARGRQNAPGREVRQFLHGKISLFLKHYCLRYLVRYHT